MRVARLWMCLFLLAIPPMSLRAAEVPGMGAETPAPTTPQAHKNRTQIYNFQDLLNKAERIVSAEVGATRDGLTRIQVRETIKAPVTDKKIVPEDKRRRATDLLNNPENKVAGPTADALLKGGGPTAVYVRAENLALPREGTQIIFFLWEPVEAPAADAVAYRANHPQNIYDAEVLPEVRAGVSRPRALGDGRYLRTWDREMAAKLRQRDTDEALVNGKGGEEFKGLKLQAGKVSMALRRDNSFSIPAKILNQRDRDQALYDGPEGGFGVVLTPVKESKDAGAVLLRITSRNLLADAGVLSLADLTDFAIVSQVINFQKELFFDAREFPVLGRLSGEYTAKIFYSSAQDGRGLDISAPVWTGQLLAEPVSITFYEKKQ